MEGMRIVKGGKLIKTEWHYDEEAESGEYKEVDITDHGIRYLFDGCTIADDVILRDIFLFLNNNIDLYDAVLGNWTREYVALGLAAPIKPHVYAQEGVEYLELKFTPEVQKNLVDSPSETLIGTCFPNLDAVGWELRTDLDHGYGNVYKTGERVPWSVLGFKVEELMEVPVKLSDEMPITYIDYTDKTNKKNWWKEVANYKNPQYTLGQILHGIMWELSWHGNPTSREDFKNELKSRVDDIKEKESGNKTT